MSEADDTRAEAQKLVTLHQQQAETQQALDALSSLKADAQRARAELSPVVSRLQQKRTLALNLRRELVRRRGA